jgi:hypothetical protein
VLSTAPQMLCSTVVRCAQGTFNIQHCFLLSSLCSSPLSMAHASFLSCGSQTSHLVGTLSHSTLLHSTLFSFFLFFSFLFLFCPPLPFLCSPQRPSLSHRSETWPVSIALPVCTDPPSALLVSRNNHAAEPLVVDNPGRPWPRLASPGPVSNQDGPSPKARASTLGVTMLSRIVPSLSVRSQWPERGVVGHGRCSPYGP